MSLPIVLTSDMTGSPNLTPTNGSVNALLNACLVNGFNTQSVTSATASGGVVTFNFASAPGFSALDTVTIAGASNATVNGQKRVQSAASNQVLVAIPGVPDGAVGGTITLKFSPLGWTRAFSGTNLGTYRQGGASSTKRFLRVSDGAAGASPWAYYTRGYENMTDISTGTGAFPTTVQVTGNGLDHYAAQDATGGLAANLQHRAWVLIGTPRFFVLYCEYGRAMYAGDTKNPVANAAWSSFYSMYFGDPANIPKPADTFACLLSTYTQNVAYAPRGVAGTGTARTVYAGMGSSQNEWNYGLRYPSLADGGIHFNGTIICYDNAAPYGLRGTIPGTIVPLEGPTASGSTSPPFAHTLTNIPGVPGRIMLLGAAAMGANNVVGWLLDEDWGDA